MFLLTAAGFCGCANKNGKGPGSEKYRKYADMTAEEITASLTLEQKANQMVMAACYDISPKQMKDNCFGSILSAVDEPDCKGWQKMTDKFQRAAIESDARWLMKPWCVTSCGATLLLLLSQRIRAGAGPMRAMAPILI